MMNIQRLDKYGNSSTDLGPIFVHDKYGGLKKIGGTGSGGSGTAGPQGNQGPTGSPGPSNGPVGPRGYQGYQGDQGIQGEGAQGAQGDRGLKGDKGDKGSNGNQGAQGYQGTGTQGPEGMRGPIGPQGCQGDRGPRGFQGDDGFQGVQGDLGIQGTQGYQGTGTQGTQGYQGEGVQGDQGAQGAQGVQGAQGAQGAQGRQGAQGVQGIQGVQGTQGTGTQGAQGTQGVQGVQGTQGYQGTGVQGAQGNQGTPLTELTISGIQNGINKVFTLSSTLIVGASHMFFMNGQLLVYGKDYSISGTILTINTDRPAPSSYDNLRMFAGIGNLIGTQGVQGAQGTGTQGYQGPQGVAQITPGYGLQYGDTPNIIEIDTLEIATKQYVDRIESGTYADYVEKISNDELLPERYYALTDYQHKYYIEESNTSLKKVFKTATSRISNFLVFNDDYAYDLNVGTVVTIESLPPTYTGGLVVGNTATVSEQQFNYYYRFSNGMSYDPSILGVEISYSYARFSTRTDLNNATVYDAYNKVILKPGGVLNTDVHDGTQYGNLTAAENFTPPVEMLVLKAKSTNSFYENCYSLTYLNDELIYDFTSNIVYNDNKEQIGTRNGFIKRRFNKDLNIDIDKDWRVQRYRRWMVPVATVDSDYRKKLLNIDYPNTNTYLAFQNKYLYTSELLNVNSTSYMYICKKIETSSLTAGITGSVASFPIVVDGTGGLNSTESIVKFKDYTILELDSFLEPVEVERCILKSLENTVFINTDATLKGNLYIDYNITFSDSTFFGYPNIKGSGISFNNVVSLDKLELFGTNIDLTNVNALSYIYASLLNVSIADTITGSLPYGVTFTGMGAAPGNTAVRWLTLGGQMSTLKNCLIGCGVATMQLNNSTISGGGVFTYANTSTNNDTSYSLFKLFSSKFTNVNYHNYFIQTQTVDNVVLSSKQIRISETTNGGLILSDSSSALYYQNVNVASPFNTVTKNYNYTTFLFETVLNIKPYKSYVALLSQSGVNPPTAVVLENTIGTISFAYNSTGFYSAVSSGLFTLNKVACFISVSNGATTLIAKANTANLVTIISQSSSGTFINDSISNATIEIRVYI